MRNLGLLFLLLASPAWGQGQPMPIAKQPAKSAAPAKNKVLTITGEDFKEGLTAIVSPIDQL